MMNKINSNLTRCTHNCMMNKINSNLTSSTHYYWVRNIGDEEGGTSVTLQGTVNVRPKTFQCTGLKMKETVWLLTGTALQTIFQVIKENNKSTFTKRNSILERKCWQYGQMKCKDIQQIYSIVSSKQRKTWICMWHTFTMDMTRSR